MHQSFTILILLLFNLYSTNYIYIIIMGIGLLGAGKPINSKFTKFKFVFRKTINVDFFSFLFFLPKFNLLSSWVKVMTPKRYAFLLTITYPLHSQILGLHMQVKKSLFSPQKTTKPLANKNKGFKFKCSKTKIEN